jgi:hypothetical protein
MTDPTFLPGVPAQAVLNALRRSPGNEVSTAKFNRPESSSALAANAFGWFLERPALLPPLPSVPMGQPEQVEIEAEMHFPWRGGRHPWLDVAVTTPTTLVGVESKRYEPFRPQKAVQFSESYGSRDWGTGMAAFDTMRAALTSGALVFQTLNAAQLVKHAYGLRTQAIKRGRGAVLVYLYAEPATWASGKPVDPGRISLHRAELGRFGAEVHGADVTFVAFTWRELLAQWAGRAALAPHANAVINRFGQT